MVAIRDDVYQRQRKIWVLRRGSPTKEGGPKVQGLEIENNMVMSWLIISMTNDLGENFLLYGTAKEIWHAVKETYSLTSATPVIGAGDISTPR